MNTIGIEHNLDRPRIKKLLVIGQVVFNAVRQLGNTALINGIGTSNKSLGAIVMFTTLLLGRRKYVSDQDFAL